MIGAIRWYLRKLQARRRGRWDGKRGTPADKERETFPPGEFRLKQTADAWFQEFGRRWAVRDRRLKGEYCALQRQLRFAHAAAQVAEEEAQRARVAHEANLAEILHERKEKRTTRGFEHEWRMSPTVYALFMLAIFIGEFPLNAIAFRLFGEAEILTWIMTAVLAFALVGGAHVLGIFLSMERRSSVESWLMTVSIVVPLGAIGAIALVRQGYLAELAQETGVVGIGPARATVVFVLINVLIYTIAAILSYFTHDPVTQRIRETEKPLREALQRLAQIRHRVEQLETTLQRVAAFRQKMFDAVGHEAAREKNAYEELIQEYRMGNLEVRADRAVPIIFRDHPSFTIPEELQRLDWDCLEQVQPVVVPGSAQAVGSDRIDP